MLNFSGQCVYCHEYLTKGIVENSNIFQNSLNINSVDNSIIEVENEDEKNDLENTDDNEDISLDTSVDTILNNLLSSFEALGVN